MKVKIVRTWVDAGENLSERYADMLQANDMLARGNRKPLPRIRPPTPRDMQQAEKKDQHNVR